MNNLTFRLPDGDNHFHRFIKNGKRYHGKELEVAIKLCKGFDVAVDIGAHVGLVSRQMAERFDKVYAFEAMPENFACLSENAAPNMIGFNQALGAKYETRSAINPAPGNTGAWELVEGNDIDIRPLDDMAHLFKHLDLIKIDTQGMELDILKGATDLINEFKPVIWYEVQKNTGIENEETAYLYNHCGLRNAVVVGNKNVIGWY
jgi:FkbM family methyltransferase